MNSHSTVASIYVDPMLSCRKSGDNTYDDGFVFDSRNLTLAVGNATALVTHTHVVTAVALQTTRSQGLGEQRATTRFSPQTKWPCVCLTFSDEGSHEGKGNELEHREHRQRDPRAESNLPGGGGGHESRDHGRDKNEAHENSSYDLECFRCVDWGHVRFGPIVGAAREGLGRRSSYRVREAGTKHIYHHTRVSSAV